MLPRSFTHSKTFNVSLWIWIYHKVLEIEFWLNWYQYFNFSTNLFLFIMCDVELRSLPATLVFCTSCKFANSCRFTNLPFLSFCFINKFCTSLLEMIIHMSLETVFYMLLLHIFFYFKTIIWILYYVKPIFNQCSTPISPKNTKKLEVFSYFRGEISGTLV